MTDPIPMNRNNPSDTGAPSLLQCPNMIAIASGKGGVGKTWFAITLSQTLAKRGKNVLLFDGDLGLANVDIQLGLTPNQDLGAVVDGKVSLANAVTKYKDGGFDILAGRSGSGNLANLATQKISDLRNELIKLAKNYDHVMIDLGAGVDRSMRQLAGPAAMTFVVITDEPTSWFDSYAHIKLARAANPNADMRIVVNMAASASEGQKTYESIRKVSENFLRYTPPLAGIIRRDAKVREAIRSQTPLMTRSPGSDAATDVEAIAKNLG